MESLSESGFDQLISAILVVFCTFLFALGLSSHNQTSPYETLANIMSQLRGMCKKSNKQTDKDTSNTNSNTNKNILQDSDSHPIKSSHFSHRQSESPNSEIDTSIETDKKEQSEESISAALKEYRELIDSYNKKLTAYKSENAETSSKVCLSTGDSHINDNKECMGGNDTRREEIVCENLDSRCTLESSYDWSTQDPKLSSNKTSAAANACTRNENNLKKIENVDIDAYKENNNGNKKKMSDRFTKGAVYDPVAIIENKGKNSQLPEVEQLGTITLEQLNQFNSDADRQCLSVLGTVFDVTGAKEKYGKDGSYQSFAGHDITLALGSGKLNEKWLDKFVQLSYKHKQGVQGWMGFYETQYPKCGKLDKWDQDISQWPRLSKSEQEELDAECSLM